MEGDLRPLVTPEETRREHRYSPDFEPRYRRRRASVIPGGPLDLEDLKIIVLMVFWSLGEEPDALILDELFVDAEERLIH